MYLDKPPIASEVIYDDTLASPPSSTTNVQAVIDWLKSQIGVGGSSGYQKI